MLIVAGIDPGKTGAVSLYDHDADKLVAVWDLPNYDIVVGGSTRLRIDEPELEKMMANLKNLFDCRLIGIEKVQGWGGKQQSASAAFQFGYIYGVIRTLARLTGIIVAEASPGVWKLVEKVPKDEKAIVKLADEQFPDFKSVFHGPKNGPLHDRAESAFLARYFARRIWPTLQPRESLRAQADAIIDAHLAAVTPKPAPPVVAKPERKARKKRRGK